ncbi:hypothetical protein [Azospirillum argentinense]
MSSYSREVVFFDGLMWYLEARNWSLSKIVNCKSGGELFDLRMYHSSYFFNLFGAIDHVRDFLEVDQGAYTKYKNDIENNIPNYWYARELRNAIVHRGLDPTAEVHCIGENVYALCPDEIYDKSGKNKYKPNINYIAQLGLVCNNSADFIIKEILDNEGLFDVDRHLTDFDCYISHIDKSTAMPIWAKDMAKNSITREDYCAISLDLAKRRVDKMRNILSGLSNV